MTRSRISSTNVNKKQKREKEKGSGTNHFPDTRKAESANRGLGFFRNYPQPGWALWPMSDLRASFILSSRSSIFSCSRRKLSSKLTAFLGRGISGYSRLTLQASLCVPGRDGGALFFPLFQKPLVITSVSRILWIELIGLAIFIQRPPAVAFMLKCPAEGVVRFG